MEGYIDNFFLKYGHNKPTHPKLTLHKHRKMKYGDKQQLIPVDHTSPDLDSAGVKRIQEIIGAMLYYSRAINNNL